MENLAKYLIYCGGALILIGAGVFIASKMGLPLGRLRGDIHVEGRNSSFYFPVVTCIVISVVLTLVLNFLAYLFKK